MTDYKWLQLFAEGGEGEVASASTESAPAEGTQATGEANPSNAQMEAIKSRIPERGKKAFEDAYNQTHQNAVAKPATEPAVHVPYADLIKSAEYKDEHKAWADKAFSDRFKAKDSEIAGLNEKIAKMSNVLGKIAPKYGLDTNSDSFLEELTTKVDADDSFIEEYAMQHDMSVEEAKRDLEVQNRVRKLEAEERQRQADEQNRQLTQSLLFHADQTRKQYPEFDLDKEWQNPEFRRQCFNNGMDTSVAYQLIHMDEILHRNNTQVAEKTKAAITNSIASGQNRPLESGLSNSPAAVVRTAPNFDGMSTTQMKEYARTHYVKR